MKKFVAVLLVALAMAAAVPHRAAAFEPVTTALVVLVAAPALAAPVAPLVDAAAYLIHGTAVTVGSGTAALVNEAIASVTGPGCGPGNGEYSANLESVELAGSFEPLPVTAGDAMNALHEGGMTAFRPVAQAASDRQLEVLRLAGFSERTTFSVEVPLVGMTSDVADEAQKAIHGALRKMAAFETAAVGRPDLARAILASEVVLDEETVQVSLKDLSLALTDEAELRVSAAISGKNLQWIAGRLLDPQG